MIVTKQYGPLKFKVNTFIVVVMKAPLTENQTIGRPRSFNPDEALQKAMLVFWQHGFESTSMSLLSKKMDMNAPSIYSAFGDKKSLFLKALEIYVGDLNEIKTFIDNSTSALEAADQLLRLSAVRFTGKETPKGCMLASAVASGSDECSDIQLIAARTRLKIESFLKARIEKDIKSKILPKTFSAEALAGLTLATIQGMSVLARDGASQKKLVLIAEASLNAWQQQSRYF